MKSPLLPYLFLAVVIVLSTLAGKARAQEDPGKAKLGQLQVTVFFATDGDPQVAGERAEEVADSIRERLQKERRLNFSHYRTLGADKQSIFRSYENWAQPLKPSDEILVRFEARSQPSGDTVSLDVELWVSKKKILKTDARLQDGRPLFVLGPEWRGGRLIISVALAH